jgi:carbamoyltransferase
MYILGVNAYHGDAAAAIIKDGKLVAAVEEERFNRFKHSAGFPTQAIHYCLQAAGIGHEAVAHVGISRDPSAHLHKKILFAATKAARATVRKGTGQAAVATPDQKLARRKRQREWLWIRSRTVWDAPQKFAT